jgi:hypothetical protein
MSSRKGAFFVLKKYMNDVSVEPRSGGVPNRRGEYAKVVKHSEKILNTLIGLLDSRNEGIRLGASKTLLGKILPDLKASEISGTDGGPIQLTVIAEGGYIPKAREIASPSAGSVIALPTEVQSTDLAQTSQKDHDGNQRDSQTGTS